MSRTACKGQNVFHSLLQVNCKQIMQHAMSSSCNTTKYTYVYMQNVLYDFYFIYFFINFATYERGENGEWRKLHKEELYGLYLSPN